MELRSPQSACAVVGLSHCSVEVHLWSCMIDWRPSKEAQRRIATLACTMQPPAPYVIYVYTDVNLHCAAGRLARYVRLNETFCMIAQSCRKIRQFNMHTGPDLRTRSCICCNRPMIASHLYVTTYHCACQLKLCSFLHLQYIRFLIWSCSRPGRQAAASCQLAKARICH